MRRCSGPARIVSASVVLALAACGGGGGDDDVARGFRIQSPAVELQPGQELTTCYYFRTPNTETLPVHTWASTQSAGTHHFMVFTTGAVDKKPVGTLSGIDCGLAASSLSALPLWAYSAYTASATTRLPTDDGGGKRLAHEIAPNTAGFLLMHFVNPTANKVSAVVTLDAQALGAGVAYTPTAPYIASNVGLSIPPTLPGDPPTVATKTCDIPAGRKFWSLSMSARKQSVKTEIKRGSASSTDVVFTSTDWENPGAQLWLASPFLDFGTGADQLTFECTYVNPTNRTIVSGDSAQIDETCMATGYQFPANAPTVCLCAQQGCFNL